VVSVPESSEPELLRFAASLASRVSSDDDDDIIEEDDDEVFTQSNGNGRTRWGWGRQAVRDAYLGGVSDAWRPFLDYLAEYPNEWVFVVCPLQPHRSHAATGLRDARRSREAMWSSSAVREEVGERRALFQDARASRQLRR
jgi:hypothetical protein